MLAPVPIYIGGLSTKLSGLYDAMSHDAQRAHPELQLLQELAPYVLSGNEVYSLFFVGYSDPESPAGRIRSASPGDEVVLDPKQAPIKLRCRIEEFNFSSHANRESLLTYAIGLRPKKIILVHGDRPAIEWFELKLYRELPETEVIIPEPGKGIVL